jgi:hypothetical protein
MQAQPPESARRADSVFLSAKIVLHKSVGDRHLLFSQKNRKSYLHDGEKGAIIKPTVKNLLNDAFVRRKAQHCKERYEIK